jgi:hypothetical protein
MIISNNEKIVICTPTKVGSTSLEEAILNRYKVGRRIFRDEALGLGRESVSHYKHGMRCDLKVKKRLILVRHPLARFASIYAFFKNSKNNWKSELIDYARKDKIHAFCEAYIKAESTVWTAQLIEYIEEFKPTKIFKLEENGIYNIAEELGIRLESVPFINKTRHGGWIEMAQRLDPLIKKQILDAHKASMELLDYR